MNFEINEKNILKFTLPCIMTMIFTSIFVMSDGIIVSNYINETALAAINIVMPVTSLFLAVGLMFGAGSSAICSQLLGEGKIDKAKQTLSSVLVVSFIIGVIFTILTQLNMDSILNFLGASEDTIGYASSYLRVLSIFLSIIMIKTIFQSIMVVSGKAFLFFKAMIVSGILKVILSYLFVAVLNLGTTGLAFAGVFGYLIPVIVSIIALSKNNEQGLSLVKPKFDKKIILDSCYNGSSEMVTNMSSAVTTFLFNSAMLKLVGDSGVSAVTVILYIQFLLGSIFMGYAIGIAPLIGFNYGKKDSNNLHKIFKSSLKILSIMSIVSFSIAFIFSSNLTSFFAEKGSEIYELSHNGLNIFAFGFLFMGFNIFASGLFTAYSNGKVSAFISAIRTLGLISTSIILLPNIFGINGVWMAVPVAEFITLFISLYLFNKYKDIYMYSGKKVLEEKTYETSTLITINRMFGSGGREVGKRLAEQLNFAYYDKDIINDILNNDGLSDEYLEQYNDINFSSNFKFQFATSFVKYKDSPSADVFEKQAEVIKKLSNKDSVFVGRCSNHILKEKNPFKVFIYAKDEDYIINRLYEKNEADKNKTEKQLKKLVKKINDNRQNYYKYYTGSDVLDLENYDLVIDISKVGLKNAVNIIKLAIEKK